MTDRYDIAAIVTVNELDQTTGKLTAARQRELFGFAPFGRSDIRFDCSNQGEVTLTKWSSCGTDTVFKTLSFAELANHINTKTRIVYG